MKKLLLLLVFIGAQNLSSQGIDDEFSYNNFNWRTISTTQDYKISGDQMIVFQAREKLGYSAGVTVHRKAIDHSNDFKITSNMRLTNGATGNGLAWNIEDARNHYKFLITDRDGQYAIYRVSNGKATAIKKWGGAPAIHKKFSWNELSVQKRGSRTYFYINGEEVHNAYISYNSYPKQVGLFLGQGSTINRMVVEDFRLETQSRKNGENGRRSDGDRAPGRGKN
ncbi:MAG: hypothetical protein CMB99_10500 [Flavobacteriaceae bacterium]|nr:hypothetical protein [Flavobacteriaceae bacterium]|tara:strand:+ start:236534 stop:237205 length:672 start_codon:yes stop_codon:yes gene_type:complete